MSLHQLTCVGKVPLKEVPDRSSEVRASILPIVDGIDAPVRFMSFRLTPVILETLLTVEHVMPGVQAFPPQGELVYAPFVNGGHHFERVAFAAELTMAL